MAVALLAMFSLPSCDHDTDIVVTATVQLTNYDFSVSTFGPADFGPYHYRNLSNRDLEMIFKTLVPYSSRDFMTGIMHLEYYNRIENFYYTPEDFSIMWDDYERDFVIEPMYY